jgi:diaminopimelate decarboxylase
MAYFYRDGYLMVGDEGQCLALETLARAHTNPIYVYDLDNIAARYRALEIALSGHRHSIHYAVKANANAGILSLLRSLGSGVDTVSGGEIRLALKAGFRPDQIIFSGVAKTVAELEFAISIGIKQINIESPQELVRIASIAKRLGQSADIAFRLNPDVNPQTHPYITTGFRENKFGMDESTLPELLATLKKAGSSLRLRGLTMHIGSQLLELESLGEAMKKTARVFRELRGGDWSSAGHSLDRIDIGGGLGIDYTSPSEQAEFERMQTYGALAKREFADLDCEILLEPGRILVGRAGLLIGEVQYIKSSPAKTFAILNTGMHHLMRPALYGAKHRVLPLVRRPEPIFSYDVVGPICESSDVLAKNIELPEIHQGDYLAMADAGAYGYSMASRYNAHELPDEILISCGRVLAE